MKFTCLEINNFRGVQHVKLLLNSNPKSKIFTLVGLNESGKTTILEAINFFSYKTESLEPLDLKGYSIEDPHSLIPIASRSNFNGEVSISVTLQCDEEDEKCISKAFSSKLNFKITKPIKQIVITQSLLFKNSKLDKKKNTWEISLSGRLPNRRKDHSLTGEPWQKAVDIVKPFIPNILYFPNFLFEFPDKIYLENTGKNDDLHSFYRFVIQDVLDALSNETNLETHILTRIKSTERNDKQCLDVLLLEMGRHISKTVFGAWNRMFKQQMNNKKVVISCDRDENGFGFLEMKIEDTDGFFLISERSLGFRWFFVFLLLTQYRGCRKTTPKNVLYLFDEPASNLHATAQAQLLESFSNLSKNDCSIIYTTHSHHLINPEWLEGAFIVRNEGLDFASDINDYSANKTKITITPYRQFVVKYPDDTSYYKPILDVLDYVPSQIEPIKDVVMLEGKTDYYVLKFAQKHISESAIVLNLLPGMGSGGLETAIKLYLGWGRNFIIMLDSDKEGQKQKARYIGIFGTVLNDRIFTLNDLNSKFANTAIEHLFATDDKLSTQKLVYSTDIEFNKTHFHRAIQENLLMGTKISFSDETKGNFNELLQSLEGKLLATHY